MSAVSVARARSKQDKSRTAGQSAQPVQPLAAWSRHYSPLRALSLPFVFTLALAAFGLLAPVRQNVHLLWAFLGAAAVLAAWNVVLLVSANRTKRTLTLGVALRKQHYLQACAQLSVFVYWGLYWS